ncbi:hypothetical protein BCU88_20435 [Vibrio splendidus]|uniref:NAD-dependent epimerase/dehydratase family protein n=1 Tax=Vibrio splendidus TaxID=29497 RepID=UPI000C8648D0|nr:NAD-dependent epimerase/dehydratase family protein [Vibrio splendidus]PMG54116.1 hypothetical protein BCU88_20435 [Vibrio splendidus]
MCKLVNKKVLLLGGTGVIGKNLTKILLESGSTVYITSRKKTESTSNCYYIEGNAQDESFVRKVLNTYKIDAIVDFMIYNTNNFSNRLDLLLEKKVHYIYLSTYRVYSESKNKLKEDAPYLKDTIIDAEYLLTNEYALSKTDQEQLIKSRKNDSWTIVRPSITYGGNRFQLAGFESDLIMPRVARGLAIPLPKEILDKKAVMTSGLDTARMICGLLFNERAFENIFNVTTSESITWREIATIYSEEIGLRFEEVPLDKFKEVEGNIWQIKYDRMFDRHCCNEKVLSTTKIDPDEITSIENGLKRELKKVNIEDYRLYSKTLNRKNGNIDRILGIYRFPLTLNIKLFSSYFIGRILILDKIFRIMKEKS